MKPKLKHMKRNTSTRKEYQKNLDNQKQTREYKKKLLKFIIFYCKANLKFYHKVLLVLFDRGEEEALGKVIRDAWVANDKSIRQDQTGFIDNSQYLESIMDHLVTEIPRIHSDDEEYSEEYSSDDEGAAIDDGIFDETVEGTEDGDNNKKEDNKKEDNSNSNEEEAPIAIEEEVEMPRKKKRKTSTK
jgi:hypothetical protein